MTELRAQLAYAPILDAAPVDLYRQSVGSLV